MADMNNMNGQQPQGGSLRDQMKQQAAARQQQQVRQAPPPPPEDDDYDEDYDEEVLEDNSEQEKSKLNIKFILVVAVGCALVALIVFMVVSGKKGKEPPAEEVPLDLPVVEEPVIEEPVVEEPVIMANYTADQMNNLRAIGITSDEITNYMENNVPYEYVYNTLMEQYWGWHLMNELPTYDMTSDKYKEVINQTWMSLPERHDLAEWTTDYIAYSYDVEANLDYEKVTPYGNQLFLKIYLDDNTHDSWFFLNIKPEEWNMLGPKGNVVVNYTYQTHYKPYESIFDAEEDKDNIFIISATLNIIKSDFAVSGTTDGGEDSSGGSSSASPTVPPVNLDAGANATTAP